MLRLHAPFLTAALLALITIVSTQSLEKLPSCWRNCITGNAQACISKPSTRINCLCNLASASSLIPDTLTCIRIACDPVSDPLNDFVSSLKTACADTKSPISSASDLTSIDPRDDPNDITATVIGYMTDSAGVTQSYAFPAVLGQGSVEYGTPTQIGGAESTTRASAGSMSRLSTVSRDSAPSSAAQSSSDVVVLSVTPSDSPTPSVTTPIATSESADVPSSSSVESTSRASSTPTSNSGSDGSLTDVGNEAASHSRAGSLLGLTIGLLAGVAWF